MNNKILSVILVFLILFFICNPIIVNAVSLGGPEGTIEFKDEELYKILLNTYGVDKNKDGFITKEEMGSLTSLQLSSISIGNVKSFDELKYAINVETLGINGLDKNFSDYSFLESFSKLKYFYVTKDLVEFNHDYKEEAILKAQNNMFFADEYIDNGYGENTRTTYRLFGISLKENMEMSEKEVQTIINGSIILPEEFKSYIKIENEDIAKVVENEKIEGIKEGNTKIICQSSLSKTEIPLTITKSDIEIKSNPELENSNVKAEIINDRVLMSNGDLWKINSEKEAIKEATDVLDFKHLYYGSGVKMTDLMLKNDGTLIIKGFIRGVHEITKEIKDVKQIVTMGKYRGAYLTINNEIYSFDVNIDTKEIETTLVANNVEKAQGAFYVKNGNTYYLDGTMVAEGVMDEAKKGAFAIGNNLYVVSDHISDFSADVSCNLKETDFESFTDEQYCGTQEVYYKSTSGEVKQTGGYKEEGIKYELSITTDDSNSFYPLALNDENTLCRYNLEFLTNVEDYVVIYSREILMHPLFVLAVRTDGTVWTKNYENQYANFEKLISHEELDLGNVDGDEDVNIKDVKLTLQYSLSKENLSEVQVKAADVNKDGKVDIKDVRLILLYSLNKINEF